MFLKVCVNSTTFLYAGNDTYLPDDPESCPNEGISDGYWIYLTVSGVLLMLAILSVGWPVLFYKLFRKTLTHKRYRKFVKKSYTNGKLNFARKVALGNYPIGNIIIILSLMINLAHVSIYWRRAYLPADICLDQFDPEWRFELAFTIYFIIYFIWRSFGELDNFSFWSRVSTIVDLVTIPHIFVSLARDRDWLGTRFLRILWFNHFIALLNHLPISRRFIALETLLTLLTSVVTFWLACSGAIHLLEVTGDPWNNFNNRHNDLNFEDYTYFIIVTISTVGYGDISPQTEAGRFFIIILIVLGLFLIGYLTPTISELLSTWSRYSGSYIQLTDVKHVVVAGHITGESAGHFLRGFQHADWNDDYTKVLFLHPTEPDSVLKAILNKCTQSVGYFKGCVLNDEDMHRVNMDRASAAIILSPGYSRNPESDDESNLMRIISIKNAYCHVKIIAQVFQLQSLQQVLSLYHWDSSKDTIICKNKLKLGLMAQNCLCPGISTLLSNLVYPISSSDLVANSSWQLEYCKGQHHTHYS